MTQFLRILAPAGAFDNVVEPGNVPALTPGSIVQSGPLADGTTVTVAGSNYVDPLGEIDWQTDGISTGERGEGLTFEVDIARDAGKTLRRGVRYPGRQEWVYTAGVAVAAISGAFSDNFNRADGGMGSDWTLYQNIDGTSNPGFQITSNQAVHTSTSVSGGQLLRTGTSITGDAFAEVELTGHSGTVGRMGVGLVDLANSACYFFSNQRQTGARELIRRIGTTNSTIASVASSTIPASALLRIERLIIDASTVRVRVLQNGSQIISFDDTSADRISTTVNGLMVARTSSGANSATFDNFAQGAV
jgi:hypothetical protein